MAWYVGVDIGAVSVTAAVICTDRSASLADSDGKFEAIPTAPAAVGQVWISEYRRTRGQPVAAGARMLQDILAAIGSGGVDGLCLTGSGAKVLADRIGASTINE